MVRRVQATGTGGDYYATENNYGYGQDQSNQDYYSYYNEQQAQPDQSTYNYAQPAANEYQQSATNAAQYSAPYGTNNYQPQPPYGASPYGSQSQSQQQHSYHQQPQQSYSQPAYNNYASPAQPFLQPKAHTSPVPPQAGYGYGVQSAPTGSWLSAFGTGGIEGEPPLLEELGINFGHIKNKTIASINPFRKLDSGALADADLAGPLLFCLLFGMSLLFSGKVHFGYIYGVATLGWLSIFGILNLMSEAGVSFYLTASVLGYCLLPMVLLSAAAVLLQLRGTLGLIMAATSITWCTFSSSTLFVSAFNMKNQQILIAYPIFLFYSCFALMTVF